MTEKLQTLRDNAAVRWTALLLLAMTISGHQKVEGFIDNSTIATATYTLQLGMVPIFVISKRTD